MTISTLRFWNWMDKRRDRHDARIRYLQDYHRWFAWYPINVGEFKWCWLETVARCLNNYFAVSPWERYKCKTLDDLGIKI